MHLVVVSLFDAPVVSLSRFGQLGVPRLWKGNAYRLILLKSHGSAPLGMILRSML